MTVLHHLIGADVLGDATRLARDDVGVSDPVEQLRLAVIDVTHDGDDRSTVGVLGEIVLVVLGDVENLLELDLLLLARVDQRDLRTDLLREELDHLVAQRLRGRDHLAVGEQEAHHVRGGPVELRSQGLRGRVALNDHHTLGHSCVLRGVARHAHRLELITVATATALTTRGALRTARTATTTGTATAGTTTRATAGTAERATAGASGGSSTRTARPRPAAIAAGRRGATGPRAGVATWRHHRAATSGARRRRNGLAGSRHRRAGGRRNRLAAA